MTLHRETEVHLCRLSGKLEDIFASSKKLHHGKREVRKPRAISGSTLDEEGLERACVWLGRELFAQARREIDDA